MIDRIIAFSINNRFFVILVMLIVIAIGGYCLLNIPLDAIPDLSDVQVIIMTEYPGQAPQVVEDQVTYPLTTSMLSVPYAKVVRGYSFFGLSFVYVIFEDGTDLYWARSRVLEYLNFVQRRLPPGVTPTLGPDATGVGWIYEYALISKSRSLQELRSIQDWYLKYELTSVACVAEVASIGGFVKQYQVTVDPVKLLAYDLPLSKIRMAIQRSNRDVGGRVIEMAETEFMIRGLGYIKSIDDVKNIAVGVDQAGTPILIKDIATVSIGPELRRGVAELDGEGEVVGGIIVMRLGENALETIKRVKKKLDELKQGLPKDVEIVPVYDRSGLILRAIATLRRKLTEEMVAVALVCLIFLLHLRSAFVAIFTLPVGILISFIIMYRMGINANIMSLGGIAIAIGVMVDASVVMVENAHKHFEQVRARGANPLNRSGIILQACREVGPALFFSLVIITLSFLPVFALQAQEGRLFKPLAYTKTFAMAASSILAITIIPVLMFYFVRGRILPETKNPLSHLLITLYMPLIRFVLRFPKTIILLAIIATLLTWFPYRQIGSEFMPPLYEGDFLYMPTTLPGISITKARELLQQTDKIIKQFPEVERVFGKIGRAETSTDPAPLSMIETTIMLKPIEEWRRGMTPDKLADDMNQAIQFPGLTNAWTMPIKTRIDMLSTGIKTPVGIKIAGPDLKVLQQLGEEIEAALRTVPGTLSVYAERVMGGNYLDFQIDRSAVARYGLTVDDVQDVIMSAIGGMNITETVEGLERYPVNLRYGRELRSNPEALRRVLVSTPRGEQIPLGQLATLSIKKGPAAIKSENARLNAWVYVDVKGIDVGTYIKRAKKAINEKITIPAGYNLKWSGQYEYMERAQKRLQLVVPLTLAIIFFLLYIHFRNVTESLIVLLSLPFALIGGIWLMWVLGFNMSVAVAVGFIALAGLAAETGIVMLVYLDEAYKRRLREGRLTSKNDLHECIIEGAVLRVRPKIMVATIIIIGLIPIMVGGAGEAGSEVMKRIASPMVGGLISSTLLTLLIIPSIYRLWRGWELRHLLRAAAPEESMPVHPEKTNEDRPVTSS
jgi:Cu(I)/Ag(I) efflux system membrane protein CusA/SilA